MSSLKDLMASYETLSTNKLNTDTTPYLGMEVYLSIGGQSSSSTPSNLSYPPENAYACHGPYNHSVGYGKWGVNTREITWEDISGNGTLTSGEDSAGASLMSTAMNITSSSAGNLNLITSSGDDTFTFFATESLTADDSIDGNAGTDTIQVSNDDDKNAVGDATTAAFGANVKGIEKILVVDAAADNSAERTLACIAA